MPNQDEEDITHLFNKDKDTGEKEALTIGHILSFIESTPGFKHPHTSYYCPTPGCGNEIGVLFSKRNPELMRVATTCTRCGTQMKEKIND